MAFATKREHAELKARVEAIEASLAVNVQVPNIEHVLSLQEVFGQELADLLTEGGYTSVEAVKVATDDDLKAITGIGAARVGQIRELLK
jgi:predicted flap endonuclease-1-like 5' DNA nuclease